MEIAHIPLKRLADIMYWQLPAEERAEVDAFLKKVSRTTPAEWSTLGIQQAKKYPTLYHGRAGENLIVVLELPLGERPSVDDIFRRQLVENHLRVQS